MVGACGPPSSFCSITLVWWNLKELVANDKFETSMRIPNRHFPTWKIKVLPPVTFPATPRLFPNPQRLQPPDSADRSCQRPRDQLFILYVGVCIPYPAAHETTIVHRRIRSPVFVIWELLRPERFLRDAMDLLGLRAQIDSFCQCEALSQPKRFWVLNPNSLFSDPSSSAKQALHIARSDWHPAFMQFQSLSCMSHRSV